MAIIPGLFVMLFTLLPSAQEPSQQQFQWLKITAEDPIVQKVERALPTDYKYKVIKLGIFVNAALIVTTFEYEPNVPSGFEKYRMFCMSLDAGRVDELFAGYKLRNPGAIK